MNEQPKIKKALNPVYIAAIIFLVIVLGIIILLIIKSGSKDKENQDDINQENIDLRISQVRKLNDSALNVVIKRNPGIGEFVGLSFVVGDGETTETVKIESQINEGKTKDFSLNLIYINASDVETISVMPIFETDSGKEIIGKLEDKYVVLETCSNYCPPTAECGLNGCGNQCGIGCSEGYLCLDYKCIRQQNSLSKEDNCTDTCTSLGNECGNHTICGEIVNCGNCSSGYVCSSGLCIEQENCFDTCNSLNYNCGTHTICGEDIDCGNCSSEYSCLISNGTCMKNPCVPKTCLSLGRNCGNISNGCGEVLNCGTCIGDYTCQTNGTCIKNPCLDSCSSLGYECGNKTICGAIINCGNCVYPEVCQSNGICHCTPESNSAFCSRYNRQCGSYTGLDNCGNSRTVSSCGSCSGTCTNGVCITCTPESNSAFCSRYNRQCGSYTGLDNCGNSRTVSSCGSCSGTCTNGVCITCTPESNSAFCSRYNRQCGSYTGLDNCGNSRTVSSCGSCSGTCTNGVCITCTPESNSAFCSRYNRQCGSYTGLDNCGNSRTVDCGDCDSPQTCNSSNMCNLPSLYNGFIGWWKLDGNVADSVGSHSAINYGSAVQTSGCVSEQCYSFDGINDYIRVAHASDLNTGADVTMSVWIKWGGTNGEQNILTKESSYEMQVDGGYVQYATNPWEWRGGTTSYISPNTWYHVVATHDGNGQQKLYINGLNKYSANSGGNIISNTEVLIIGARPGASYFNGLIDDVRLWNRVLSPTEVEELFESYNYVPPACTPESNSAFCSRYNRQCGSYTGLDNCGNSRTVSSCGSCSGTCTNGICTTCSNECTSGERECYGTGYRVCGNSNSDSCTEWIQYSCSYGCSGGYCNSAPEPSTDGFIINHLNTDITQIPSSCIEKAKTLTFQYAHRSDGANILEGLNSVYNKNNAFRSAYQIDSLPSQTSPIRLRIMDGNPPMDDYSYPEYYWNSPEGRSATRSNWGSENFDGSMWSWCSEFNQGYLASDLAYSYINIMDDLESEYPGIKFVYMTSYGDTRDSNIATANKIIRDFAVNNNKILFDFEDIGRCDPDGYCYSTATRDCSWCSSWCSSHSSYCSNLPSSCSHTHPLLCFQRAKAFWWMMARMAGWDGVEGHGC